MWKTENVVRNHLVIQYSEDSAIINYVIRTSLILSLVLVTIWITGSDPPSRCLMEGSLRPKSHPVARTLIFICWKAL